MSVIFITLLQSVIFMTLLQSVISVETPHSPPHPTNFTSLHSEVLLYSVIINVIYDLRLTELDGLVLESRHVKLQRLH